MLTRERKRLIFSGSVLLLAFAGCVPNLDGLSTDFGRGGGGTGGAPGGSGNEGGSAGAHAGGPSSGGTAGAVVGAAGAAEAGEAGATATGGKGGKGGMGSGGTGVSGTGGTGTGGTGTSGTGGESGALECAPGKADCNSGTGCETTLALGNPTGSTVDDCGACGTTCSLTNATKSTCSAGSCTPTCAPNFANCNLANDGCEQDITGPYKCGSCNHQCSNLGTTKLACSAGTCRPTCAPNYFDCNLDTGAGADDGCEAYLGALNRCGTSCSNPVACPATQVCNAGACGAAQGVAVLTVTFTAGAQDQRYADRFFNANLTNATLTTRLYAPGAKSGSVFLYFSDANSNVAAGGVTVTFDTLSKGWVDVTMPVPAAVAGGWDPTSVKQLTMEVLSDAGSTTWAQPTVIYIDSVATNNLSISHTFNTLTDEQASMAQSSQTIVPNSHLDWANALP